MQYIKEGASVVIMDIDASEGEAKACANPEKIAFVKSDVRLIADWENARDVALQKFGKIDIVIVNHSSWLLALDNELTVLCRSRTALGYKLTRRR